MTSVQGNYLKVRRHLFADVKIPFTFFYQARRLWTRVVKNVMQPLFYYRHIKQHDIQTACTGKLVYFSPFGHKTLNGPKLLTSAASSWPN